MWPVQKLWHTLHFVFTFINMFNSVVHQNLQKNVIDKIVVFKGCVILFLPKKKINKTCNVTMQLYKLPSLVNCTSLVLGQGKGVLRGRQLLGL